MATDYKHTLRRELRARRDALDPAERALRSQAVCAHLETLTCVRAASSIAGYRAFGSELSIDALLARLDALDKGIALPRVERASVLSLRQWRANDALLANRWGIDEPLGSAREVELERVDLVIVPALGLDRAGHRLGYGAGHYDRLLPKLVNAVRVGVGFELQLEDALESEPHDARMHFIVTETGARAVAH